MNVVVIGTGYVGLVTGTCLAEIGHHVTCVDIDERKVESLRQGILPIYEPGLKEFVLRNAEQGRLHFETDLSKALTESAVVFIAVGTPSDKEGAADLRYVFQVAESVGQLMQAPCVIVNKSTVPVGTSDRVHSIIEKELKTRNVSIDFSIASNPEFLKEGKAVTDFMKPDRIVIGVNDDYAKKQLSALYQSFVDQGGTLLIMSSRDAEMTKYASNALLATKISFMNEMSLLCDAYDVDIEQVRQGMSLDPRIGPHFIFAGCGYGGSCFPKDVRALVQMSHEKNIDAFLLRSVDERNQEQQRVVYQKLKQFVAELDGKTIALLGLAFKPDTDDMRDASSLVFLNQVMQHDVIVTAYDPVAMDATKKCIPQSWIDENKLQFTGNALSALDQADICILMTEWSEFKALDLSEMSRMMRGNILIDGRNIFNPDSAKKAGFNYVGIGRKSK